MYRCIISAFTYGKKGYKLWVITTVKDPVKTADKIDRDFCGKIDSLKVRFPLYFLHCSFLYHWTILYYTTLLICWVFFWVLNSISFTGLIPFGRVTLPIHQKKLTIPFGECGGSSVALKSCIGIFPQGWKRHQTNWWVPYAFGPPWKLICHTN